VKRFVSLLLLLALGLPLLSGCDQPQTDYEAFDTLARRLPGNAEQAFFLNLKPAGEANRHWTRIRRQLKANPTGQEALDAMQAEFQVMDYDLEEVAVGLAVSGFHSSAHYVVVPVSDEQAVEQVLLQHSATTEWEQEEFEGKTLYHGQFADLYPSALRWAWTLDDGHLFLVSDHREDPLLSLESMLSLAPEDSLVALSSWQTLRKRLPEDPLGLVFLNIAEQTRLYPPEPDTKSLNKRLNPQMDAIALAAVPEEHGIRVEIEGIFDLKGDVPLELLALFETPAVEIETWTALPPDTALAFIGHDASALWPWLTDMLGIDADGLDLIRDTIGLDLEADLLEAGGPLSGDFALGITPPLPDQPIIEGLTAAQLLFLSRDADEAQADGIRAAMEDRGAIFGPVEVEGVPLQTQVGTELTGYAVSYGFDEDLLFLGSSPQVIGRGIAAWRAGGGLVELEAFRTVQKLPGEATLFFYIGSDALTELMRANTTEEELRNSFFLAVQAFEAIGLGLRLDSERLEGTAYFLMTE
jgi:hypothetical protein